jgi:adenosylhomocysteine nucleosidase
LYSSPLGQWFEVELIAGGQPEPVIFFHGGWGKIAAAASAQYVIDRWQPVALINLGTCGGFAGEIERGALILVERTVVYDIVEQMMDSAEAIRHYSTTLDLSWLGETYPQPVYRSLLVSGDRDLMVEDLPRLRSQFRAVAGDWESGAIAWVAHRNGTRCLILRGITDLVGAEGGEAYDGHLSVFIEGTRQVFEKVLPVLPEWIALVVAKKHGSLG